MTNLKPTLAIALSCLMLAGCATSTDPNKANVYGSPVGQKVVGNENGVMIDNVWDELDAFPVAEQFCARYGKTAKFKSTQGFRAAYDCV